MNKNLIIYSLATIGLSTLIIMTSIAASLLIKAGVTLFIIIAAYKISEFINKPVIE